MKRLISTGLLVFIFAMASLPVFANSNGWSFTMNYRYVNGKDNGQIHTMTAGSMSLSGSLRVTGKDIGALATPNKVYIGVYQDVVGPDKYLGYTTVTPSSSSSKSLSKSYGAQKAGKYYIEAYKAEDDGWNLSASGTIKTQ